MNKVFALLFLSLLFLGCTQTPSPSATSTPSVLSSPSARGECSSASDCIAAGCSGQLCVSKTAKQMATTCEYRQEYSCFAPEGCECVNGKCAWNQATQACVVKAQEFAATKECISLCGTQKLQNADLSKGPCLSNQVFPDWVCDVAHDPRASVDNDAANQCLEYGVSVHHFVEVTPECSLIRTR